MSFDPNRWAAEFNTNNDECERNQMMDSGWSSTTALNCQSKALQLYWELYAQLTLIPILPSDSTDRPELAAVLSAVQQSQQNKGC